MSKSSYFLVFWMLVIILSLILGSLLSPYIKAFISRPESSVMLFTIIQFYIYLGLVGVISSLGYRLLLSSFNIDARQWFLNSIAGWTVGIILSIFLGALLMIVLPLVMGPSAEHRDLLGSPLVVVIPFALGTSWVMSGLVVGVFQSSVIRYWGGKRKQWVIISGLSWLIGGILGLVLSFLLPFWPFLEVITMGAVVGFATGKWIQPIVFQAIKIQE